MYITIKGSHIYESTLAVIVNYHRILRPTKYISCIHLGVIFNKYQYISCPIIKQSCSTLLKIYNILCKRLKCDALTRSYKTIVCFRVDFAIFYRLLAEWGVNWQRFYFVSRFFSLLGFLHTFHPHFLHWSR